MPPNGAAQLIDVFEGGQPLTDEDAAKIVRDHSGKPLQPEHLAAADNTSILVRMLTNLLGVAQRGPDREAMLRYLDALAAIDPDSISHRGMRAIVRYETGRRDAAIADLDWIIDQKPPGLDLDGVRRMREHFQGQQP